LEGQRVTFYLSAGATVLATKGKRADEYRSRPETSSEAQIIPVESKWRPKVIFEIGKSGFSKRRVSRASIYGVPNDTYR